MADPNQRNARETFLASLSQRHWRLTAQRRAIVDAVFSTSEHFTAEQLLAWARQRDRSVSRATVYRTLPFLIGTGLLREIDLGKDRKCYDPNYAGHPNHSHIVCQDCGRVIEFEDEDMLRLGETISARLGFKVVAWRLQITGACELARRGGTCPHRPRQG